MSEKYLNYEGLSTYNRKIKKYIQSRTPDATEDKKGLLKISDLPAYTSNRYTRFSGDFESGHYDEGEFQDIFSFLAKAADGTDYSTGEIPDSAVFPTYTVVIDGKVFENVECFHSSDPWPFFSLEKVSSGDEMGFDVDYSAGTGYNHYSHFFTETEEQGEEDSGILHHLEVYQENAEEIHKLDNKYLNIAQSVADGETGLATGDQVYDYVQSVAAPAQSISDGETGYTTGDQVYDYVQSVAAQSISDGEAGYTTGDQVYDATLVKASKETQLSPNEIVDFVEIKPTSIYSSSVITDYIEE